MQAHADLNPESPTVWSGFPRITAPGTGRQAIRLTSGPGFCYPLYYFIPSITRDGRHLIYHRADAGEVQLHCLDLGSGVSVQLTRSAYPHAHWRPWCSDPGRGVLDHRSVLNRARDEVIYCDGVAVRAVSLTGRDDRLLFTVPADRLLSGQNCCSPDGRYLFYIHHDRALYDRIFGEPGTPIRGGYDNPRHLSVGTRLERYNLDTGDVRTVMIVNAPIHHVQACGDRHLAFSSRATEPSILYTDYDGGWYTHLRTRTDEGGTTCHYCATARGLAYEATLPGAVVGGMVSPETRRTVEFRLPADTGYAHVGFDGSGRRFIFERRIRGGTGHDLIFLRSCGSAGAEWQSLIGDWPTYGEGQKSHFHPRVVLGGRHLLITAGDPATQTNQIFLLDISDLPDSAGADIPN